MDYTEKYLIYKKKYIDLKKLLQNGGMDLKYASASQFASKESLKEINKTLPKFKKDQLCIIDSKRICRIVTHQIPYKVEYKDDQGLITYEDKVIETRLIECPKSIINLPNPYIYKILQPGQIVLYEGEQVKIIKIQNDINKEYYEIAHIGKHKPNSLFISRNRLDYITV